MASGDPFAGLDLTQEQHIEDLSANNHLFSGATASAPHMDSYVFGVRGIKRNRFHPHPQLQGNGATGSDGLGAYDSGDSTSTSMILQQSAPSIPQIAAPGFSPAPSTSSANVKKSAAHGATQSSIFGHRQTRDTNAFDLRAGSCFYSLVLVVLGICFTSPAPIHDRSMIFMVNNLFGYCDARLVREFTALDLDHFRNMYATMDFALELWVLSLRELWQDQVIQVEWLLNGLTTGFKHGADPESGLNLANYCRSSFTSSYLKDKVVINTNSSHTADLCMIVLDLLSEAVQCDLWNPATEAVTTWTTLNTNDAPKKGSKKSNHEHGAKPVPKNYKMPNFPFIDGNDRTPSNASFARRYVENLTMQDKFNCAQALGLPVDYSTLSASQFSPSMTSAAAGNAGPPVASPYTPARYAAQAAGPYAPTAQLTHTHPVGSSKKRPVSIIDDDNELDNHQPKRQRTMPARAPPATPVAGRPAAQRMPTLHASQVSPPVMNFASSFEPSGQFHSPGISRYDINVFPQAQQMSPFLSSNARTPHNSVVRPDSPLPGHEDLTHRRKDSGSSGTLNSPASLATTHGPRTPIGPSDADFMTSGSFDAFNLPDFSTSDKFDFSANLLSPVEMNPSSLAPVNADF